MLKRYSFSSEPAHIIAHPQIKPNYMGTIHSNFVRYEQNCIKITELHTNDEKYPLISNEKNKQPKIGSKKCRYILSKSVPLQIKRMGKINIFIKLLRDVVGKR